MTSATTDRGVLVLGGQEHPLRRRWAGDRFCPVEPFLAFDVETDPVDLQRAIPRLALASASAGGGRDCLIHPDDVGRFLLTHRHLRWVCHHSAFDFWVVEAHLRRRGEEEARRLWWELADQGRLHDTMILDQLVRLAVNDAFPVPRDLAVVAQEYAGVAIRKDDSYRLRYGEIIGKDWNTIENGFFEYALKNAIAIRPTYLAMSKQAVRQVDEFGRGSRDIRPDAQQKFGLLTESVQVKKAIALAQITRNGLTVDLDWVRQANPEVRKQIVQFCPQIRDWGPPTATIHPCYNLLVRSGRTSCTGPNIQAIPKESAFRQAFSTPPGFFLLIADYTFIELRTFAATALQRYGWSKMAEVIKAGVDPHAHTAALMLKVPVEEFRRWKDDATRKDQYDKARQSAKPVNFGVPSGLGVASLAASARNEFQVELTEAEAKTCRERLIQEIYPELDLYLAEDALGILARNLQAPVEAVRNELGDTALSSVSKILAGDPKRIDGKPYQKPFVSGVWASLAALNRNPDLKESLQNREPSKELAARVCQTGVATASGRIRGRVQYSQARNTPFQGLAADGAALALFDLIKEGYRVVAFVHDEILTLLPDEGGSVAESEVQRVKEIMCRAMAEVLVGGIPVDCEMALATCWSKKAKMIARDGRVYPWKPVSPAASSV